MKKRLSALLLACAMVIVMLAGCNSSSTGSSDLDDTTNEAKDELVFVNYRDIRDLNPHLYAGEMYAQEMLFDTLVNITEDGFEGALAES